MNTASIRKVETSPFSRADLEGKLLMVDDDLDMSALPASSQSPLNSVSAAGLRPLVKTAFAPLLLLLHLNPLRWASNGFPGNGALTSLHDRSDGFFRRQIILTTRDKPPDREDDPFLAEKLTDEREGIFLWCMEGLRRLIANNYSFTISDRARENIAQIVQETNNVVAFLASEGYVRFKADSEASTGELYDAYCLWCKDNADKAFSTKSFSTFLARNADAYRLEASNNVRTRTGKRCRGYLGIEVTVQF